MAKRRKKAATRKAATRSSGAVEAGNRIPFTTVKFPGGSPVEAAEKAGLDVPGVTRKGAAKAKPQAALAPAFAPDPLALSGKEAKHNEVFQSSGAVGDTPVTQRSKAEQAEVKKGVEMGARAADPNAVPKRGRRGAQPVAVGVPVPVSGRGKVGRPAKARAKK